MLALDEPSHAQKGKGEGKGAGSYRKDPPPFA